MNVKFNVFNAEASGKADTSKKCNFCHTIENGHLVNNVKNKISVDVKAIQKLILQIERLRNNMNGFSPFP